MRGCLTLKFSGSWKTVLTALSSEMALVGLSWLSDVVLPSTGEMGMVSRGTCWEGFGAVATSAIVIVVEGVEGVVVWWCYGWQTNRVCGGWVCGSRRRRGR